MERPARMKTIGILGGMSDQATAEYYRLINAGVNRRLGGWDIAETLIAGCNFGNIEYYVHNGFWDEAGEYLADKARSLERAGADLLVCVSNTAHRVADRFCAGLQIPFLHIADPTGAAIRAAGLSRAALLGTKTTMSAPFLRDYYGSKFGLEITVPAEEVQAQVDRIIWNELVHGETSPESKEAVLRICDGLQSAGAEGVILGCTELFLLVSQADRPGFPMFDTTCLHVAAIVEAALSTT